MRQKEATYSSFGKIPVILLKGGKGQNRAKKTYIKINTLPSTFGNKEIHRQPLKPKFILVRAQTNTRPAKKQIPIWRSTVRLRLHIPKHLLLQVAGHRLNLHRWIGCGWNNWHIRCIGWRRHLHSTTTTTWRHHGHRGSSGYRLNVHRNTHHRSS